MYKVGDKVVYPHHGAGTVVKKEKRKVLGEEREYLQIQILHNDMTVQVPTENADRVGLRKVIDETTVEQVLKALRGSGTTMPKNWNRRFKHNRDKMKTGDIFELAEVVRNLSLRDHEKGLSTGEKQMFVKAKKILVSELMYAKGMDEEEAAEWLDDILAGVGAKKNRAKVAAQGVRSLVVASGQYPMSVWAILAAAGSGERLGLDRPKAFASLNDRPLVAEPLERLDGSDWIEGIVVAAPPEWEEPCILVAEEVAAGKVAKTVTGGASRSESVRAALAEVPDEATVVLVHDAARPVVPDEVIERLVTALADGWDAAVPVLPIADTVKRVEGETVTETLEREGLVTVQTPQAFVAPVLRAALTLQQSVTSAPDCASLVEARGGRVRAVEGDPRLLKVTTPADLELVASWL